MTSAPKTPIEARVAHVVGTALGILTAIIGFASAHKGVVIPATGLTVGGALALASQWRYVRVVEGVITESVDWEKANSPAIRGIYALLPGALKGRLQSAESRLDDVEATANAAKSTAEAKATVDTASVVQQVISSLAASAAPAAAAASSAPASNFQDPPLVAQGAIAGA